MMDAVSPSDAADREVEMDPDSPEPLRYTGFLIRRAQQVHEAVWQGTVSSTVSSVQYGVLSVLERRPGASQRELCDEVDLDRSTVADIVARLQRRGLISRTRDDLDRRQNVVQLTEQGAAEIARLRPRVERVEHILTDALTPVDRDQLRRILVRFLDIQEGRG
jgi:DNA-binding MarR family transcriptional regulator